MTQLLVSVRDAREAETALRSGVHLIDVKEPARGSLGAADGDVIQQVADVLGGRVPCSAALGELTDPPGVETRLPEQLGFAKIGLAGSSNLPDWPDQWAKRLAMIPSRTVRVAVAYADWPRAEAPDPESILARGAELGCGAVLVDTFVKDGKGLLDHWPLQQVKAFLVRARRNFPCVVLAGSLDEESIGRLLPLRPDYLAVRGAACDDARTSALNPAKIQRLIRLLEASPASAS
ncbi:MAG: (5-formylfuran-3-yl)methyl phosphate synthase [Planctomycetales bacterium]